jgi:DNA-binding protein H-NS
MGVRRVYFGERRIVHSDNEVPLPPVERCCSAAAPRNVIHSDAPAISLPLLIREAAMNLKAMSFDKLSKLREQVDAILNAKVAEERRAVQSRLHELDRLAVNGAHARGAGRGSRGSVAPKYRNPENPEETWAEAGAEATLARRGAQVRQKA